MAFKHDDLMKEIKLDNSKYERILKSDLHEVVEMLAKTPLPQPAAIATEMKKVSKDKWKKYAKAHAYLLKEFPALKDLLRGAIVKFATKSITKGQGGQIVHVIKWESDTGDLKDLGHLKVREHVLWPDPAKEVAPFLIDKDPVTQHDYKKKGEHAGQGRGMNGPTTPGPVGQNTDTHSALGPYSPEIFKWDGKGKQELVFDQVYEWSDDNGTTWTAIDGSAYTIKRQVVKAGSKLKITITKTNKTNAKDTLSNVLEV